MTFQTMNLLYNSSKKFNHVRNRMQDLTDTECRICFFALENPDHPQDDAAIALQIDKTTVAKAVAALESMGCVTRTTDPADRRRKLLRVTEAGKNRIDAVLNAHNEWFTQVMSCLSPKEQDQFEDLCERILRSAEAVSDNAKKKGDSVAK